MCQEKSKINKSIIPFFVYGTPMLVMAYPIADKIHFFIGSFIVLLGVIYVLLEIGKKAYNKIKFTDKNRYYKITTMMIALALASGIVVQAFCYLYEYYKSPDKNTEISHYKNIIVEDYLKQRIEEIEFFIKEEEENREVAILDAEAAIYQIPLNKYMKNYDMFLKGNIGKDGEDGIIEQIKQSKNKIYLIRKQNLASNWQTPTKVVKYVRDNLDLVGEVSIYDVYYIDNCHDF